MWEGHFGRERLPAIPSRSQGDGQWDGCEDVYTSPTPTNGPNILPVQPGGLSLALPCLPPPAHIHRNQRSYLDFTEPVCGPEGPHGCEAPSAAPCSRHTAHHWSRVRRGSLHNPDMRPMHSKGLCPHFCPDSQCTHMSPVVNDTPPDLQALQNIPCCLPSNLQSG